MAAFTALNSVTKVVDAETRTKELQLEEAVKTYQKALQLHQEKKWAEAERAYISLLTTEVIQERLSKKPGAVIVDSPQCRLQRLVLKNYAQFIMDVLPTRTPQTVEQMLPVAMKFFAEALCYNSDDVSVWFQVVTGADKLERKRLLRFGLESILYETLKGRTNEDGFEGDEVPILPPMTYKAVKGLMRLLPTVHDEFSYDFQVVKQIARSVGIEENPDKSDPESRAQKPLECEQLRVEADTWYSLGKCLLNAFSKLGAEHLVCTSVKISPFKKDRQNSSSSVQEQAIKNTVQEQPNPTPMTDEPDETNDGKSAKRRRSISEPEDMSKRRLSKRVKALEESAPELGNARAEEYIRNLNAILAPHVFGDYCNMEFFNRSNLETSDRALDIWKTFLWEWSTERALPFETNYKHKSTSHVADTLLFERAAMPMTNRADPERLLNGSFEEFSNEVVEDGLHLGQCAVRWLEALTISPDATYRTVPWAKEFSEVVSSVSVMYEDSILDRVKALFTESSFSSAEPIGLQDLQFAQCMFELFVNKLFFKAYDKSTVLSGPSVTAEKIAAANEKLTIARDRASRWKIILGDLLQGSTLDDKELTPLKLRYRWACVVIAVCDGASDEILYDLFTGLKSDLTSLSEDGEVRIRLPNCPAIYEISASAATREISKLQTIDYFRKMFQSSSTNDPETIQELKKVLNPDPEATGTLAVVQDFISGSSLDFRLSLLHRLEELLYRSGSPIDALSTALCKSLSMVGETLNNIDDNDQGSPRQREEIFLKTLKTTQSLVARSLNILDEIGDNQLDWLSPSDLKSSFGAITTILRILTVFSFYEEAAEEGRAPVPSEAKYQDFCAVMRDMLCETWRLFYLIFRRLSGITSVKLQDSKPAEPSTESIRQCCELLSIVHEELGVRKWCGHGNGKLLTLMMDQFLKYNKEGAWDNEILQCMFCLYGISVSNEEGYPFMHGTGRAVLDGDMAVRVAQFLLHLYSNKRPGFTQLKADYKAALDTVCRSIDQPSLSSKQALAFEVNAGACDNYLREYIDPLKFLNCVKGNLTLTSIPLTPEGVDIEDLYYMQGHIHLNQFRARVKSNRSGGEDDLTLAVEHFRKDLLFHPDRWETWYALAQTYTLESDNALAWAADRIDKDRKTIARYQRKSILCFMMAVSCFARGEIDLKYKRSRKLAAPLYFDFGWQVYNSCRPPMDMGAFANDTYKISSGDQGLYVRHRSKLAKHQVLGFAAQCFNSAFAWGQQDWQCSYMLGKCLGKLDQPPTLVLNWYKNAVESAPERSHQGSGELVLDPHYKIIAVALKYVLRTKLSVEDAMPYILSTSYCPRVTDISYVDRTAFLDLVLTTLRNIKSSDKKHWHHRPVYRIAFLLEMARGDFKTARLEMDNVVGGATKVKALVSIWRPEFERSGRHFVYASRYVMYYIHLLKELQDLETLRTITPKIRKSSNLVVNHAQVWEYVCTTYLRLLRERWEIDPAIGSVPLDEFNAIAERIEMHYMPVDHTPTEVQILRDVVSLRKLNNNLISVSWFDDFLVDCYMKIYKLVREDGRRPETAISIPSTSREASVGGDEDVAKRPMRVSRKDILQKVFALCKPPPTVAKTGRGKNAAEEAIVLDEEEPGRSPSAQMIEPAATSEQLSRVPSPEAMEVDPSSNM